MVSDTNKIKKECRETKALLARVLDALARIENQSQIILDNQAALQDQIDQLRNGGYQQQHAFGPAATPAPLNVPRDILQPNNDNGKVTVSDVHTLLETLGFMETGTRCNAYDTLSQLAEEAVSQLQIAVGTPGECQ